MARSLEHLGPQHEEVSLFPDMKRGSRLRV